MTTQRQREDAAIHGDGEESAPGSLVDEIAALGAETRPPSIDGIVVGRIVAIADGQARIDYAGNPLGEPVEARAWIELGPAHVGRDVAVSFERGRPERPIVLGLMAVPRGDAGEGAPAPVVAHAEGAAETSSEEPLVLDVERDVEIRCGRASIALTRCGKIVLRGEYVLSHAVGTNRILGGSVRIN